MMSSIQSMMERYQPQNAEAYRNALKEIVQEIALYGMSKSGFFQEGAFLRGNCLENFLRTASFFGRHGLLFSTSESIVCII